ncbi:MAG: thiolase family protein [Deltaproteobacteria bacterium]|nr:thiolase family protein [Deltaproteobacteria bacterium]
MKEAVIVSAVRTAVGRAPRGALCHMRPEAMGAAVLKDLLQRTPGLDPKDIDDVIVGCSFPEAEQGVNLGRVLVAAAGLPQEVSGLTVNRFCSSGLQAIAQACERIMTDQADIVIGGGVESMSMIPMGGNLMYPLKEIIDTHPGAYEPMGLTAENVAERCGINRGDQDIFAYQSQMKASAAVKEGRFKEQIVPLSVEQQKFNAQTGKYEFSHLTFDTDEGIRPDTTVAALAALRPAFKPTGTVTAGNSSQTSDGSAAVMVMSKKKAKELGLKPMATFRGFQVAGCEPEVMGLGPIYAIPKLMKRTGRSLEEIDLFELNEAFASQALACMRELKLNPDKVNVNGGAIALGHPLGCTGAKLTTQLVYEMVRRNVRYGVVSMCIGFGMGAAGLFERENY